MIGWKIVNNNKNNNDDDDDDDDNKFILHRFHGEMINGETPMHKIKYVSNKQKLQLRASLRKSLTKHLS